MTMNFHVIRYEGNFKPVSCVRSWRMVSRSFTRRLLEARFIKAYR